MERINVLEQLVDEYFDKHPQATKFTLLAFLKMNESRIAGNYDWECHKEDIIDELIERDYDTDKIPELFINEMTYKFEDWLCDYGSETGWRTLLNELIEYFEQDLEEYYIEESDE